MILVDTSVWIDHFHKKDARLIALLEDDAVLVHPFILGELACGSIKNRDEILELLDALPKITTVNMDEVRFFVNKHHLYGKGVGYIDVHLIASCMIDNARLYTRDKRLSHIAKEFNLLYK